MELTTIAPVYNQDLALECPSCGDTYLHHEVVEVYQRESEDAPRGLHVTVGSPAMAIDTAQDGNPSRRRNGLRIRFRCEGCEAEPALVIEEHKGQTFMGWEEEFVHDGQAQV